MERQQEEVQTTYSHLEEEDKHYFGSFLNLAQDNIERVMQEFCSRLNLDKKENKQVIDEYFDDKYSFTDWERRTQMLEEYFPVISLINLPVTDSKIKELSGKKEYNGKNAEAVKRDYFRKSFKSLLDGIGNLRNYYTHYYHSPIALPEELFKLLDDTLLRTAITVRKKRMKGDKTRELLKKSHQDELIKLCSIQKSLLIEKKKKNSKIDPNNEEEIENAVLNNAFSAILYKNELSKRYLSAQSMDVSKQSIHISISRLVFLLSMFLGRKEVEHLMSNIKEFKQRQIRTEDISEEQNNLRLTALRWVFSALAFKGAKQRLTSTFDTETLLMQMLDELNKVPDEVYQTLSEKDKESFLEDINEYISETGQEDEVPLHVIHPVIRKRYENKFNYFAVRFLDEFANFPTLRFQVCAGQYLHDTREKEVAGVKLISDRMVKERINVFDKLSGVVEKKNKYFTNMHCSSEEAEGWELFPNPSYNFVGNNIHIYVNLIEKDEEAKNIQIEKNRIHAGIKKSTTGRNLQKTSKEKIINKVFEEAKVNYAPTAILSTNELMPMLYEFLKQKKSGREIEERIIEKIKEVHRSLKNASDKAEMSHKGLPKKLSKTQTDKEGVDYEKLKRAIQYELEKGEEKQRLISKYENEVTNQKRKYVFYSKEKGEEAAWIANDIKRFMPLASRKEWKGYQHSELQRLIAYYDTNRNEAKELLRNAWNMEKDSWGSTFLPVFDEKEFHRFYKRYIRERSEILTGLYSMLNGSMDEPKILKKALKEVFVVFRKRDYHIKPTNEYVKELLAKPFAFSRGIFDEKPTVIEGCDPAKEPEKFADWYAYSYNYEGGFQQYYALERNYNAWYKKLEEQKEKLPSSKRFSKKCKSAINQIKCQDIYTKLMAEFLLNKIFKIPENEVVLDLNQLYETPGQRQRNREKAMEQQGRNEGDTSENKLNESYIWNKTFPVSFLGGRVKDESVKLKDFGKFRRFLTDSKVEALLSYDEQRIWNKIMLEDELENKPTSYEMIRRHQLLKQIQAFEKELLQINGFDGQTQPEGFTSNGNPNFKMYVIEGALSRKNRDVPESDRKLLTDKKFEDITVADLKQTSPLTQKAYLLIYLRNKFSHNQLPDKTRYNLMLELCKKENEEPFSAYFNRLVTLLIKEL